MKRYEKNDLNPGPGFVLYENANEALVRVKIGSNLYKEYEAQIEAAKSGQSSQSPPKRNERSVKKTPSQEPLLENKA